MTRHILPDGKLRKKERILKTGDFRKVYRKGRSRKAGSVILYCLPNELSYSRIGFSISSGTVKSARIRNRFRRIFREIYRKSKPRISPGFDLVWIVRNDFGGRISCKVIEPIFLKLTKDLGVLS